MFTSLCLFHSSTPSHILPLTPSPAPTFFFGSTQLCLPAAYCPCLTASFPSLHCLYDVSHHRPPHSSSVSLPFPILTYCKWIVSVSLSRSAITLITLPSPPTTLFFFSQTSDNLFASPLSSPLWALASPGRASSPPRPLSETAVPSSCSSPLSL